MNRWYSTAAVSGSGFESLADNIVSFEEIDLNFLKNIDLLFLTNKSDFYRKFRLYQCVALSDKAISKEDQEKFILLNPGLNFLSRIGHDLVNLFTPFEQFEYLDDGVIYDRVATGVKFGKQINTVGHILQGSKFGNIDEILGEDIAYNIETLAKKSGIKFNMKVNDDFLDKTVSFSECIMDIVIEEIIDNCKNFSKGTVEIMIGKNAEIVFSNRFDDNLAPCRAKARLRWPFVKSVKSKGNGMGLFLLSAASANGGFKWDIEIKENIFSLYLSF
jgi:hypothetical protein